MAPKQLTTCVGYGDTHPTMNIPLRENKRRRVESQRPLPVMNYSDIQQQNLIHNSNTSSNYNINNNNNNNTKLLNTSASCKNNKAVARINKQSKTVCMFQNNETRVKVSNIESKKTNNENTNSSSTNKHKPEDAARPLIQTRLETTQTLLTPKRKKVNVCEFLLSVDHHEVVNQNQVKSHAAYRAELDGRLMELEKSIAKKEEWFLSFGCTKGGEGASLEACRLETIKRYFVYGKKLNLRPQTLHLCVHTLGRLFSHLLLSKALTQEMAAGCMASAWRMAVKMNEVPHIAYKACLSKGIREHLVFLDLSEMNDVEFDSMVSRVEAHCADVLRNDVTIPFTLDFFDRFLDLGGWPPDLASAYRELGQFLVSICLFDTKSKSEQDKNNLAGTVPSQIAAAALVLAVKIINTDANMVAYDYYPQRLEEYTGYSMKALKPTIRSISQLLRDKPKQSDVLSKWFPNWAVHDWK